MNIHLCINANIHTHPQTDSSHSGPENVATVEQQNESHQVDRTDLSPTWEIL